MTGKKQEKYVRQQTLFTAVIIAVGLGFLGGVVLTTYKLSRLNPPDVHEPIQKNISEMTGSLESETVQNPDNVQAWIQLGNLYFDSEAYDKAIRAYEKALELKPGNPDVLTDLGVMYRSAGHPDKAIHAFDRAIAADPNHETAHFNKGIVLMHDIKDQEQAVRIWKNLLEINPLFTTPNGQTLQEIVAHYTGHGKNN